MYAVPGSVFVAFDRLVTTILGVDPELLVGGTAVIWTGMGPGGFHEGVCGGIGPGDVWSMAPGPDASIETALGVPGVFAAQGGVVLLLN